MFTSFLNRRRPQQSTKIKRKWESNESVNEEEQDWEICTDQLQTPPNKRLCMSDLSQQGSRTPFNKVSSWVKETVKKTVHMFRSFADKYSFWQDEVDDDSSSDIATHLCQHPVMKHSSSEQCKSEQPETPQPEREENPTPACLTFIPSYYQGSTSRTCATRGRDEATPSYWKKSSFEDNFTRLPLHEHSMLRRKVYDPSRYTGRDGTQDSLRKEFRPRSTTSYRKDTGNLGAVMNAPINVRKTKANGPSQNMKSLKENRTGTMTESVVRLQEREQYRQLVSHYTSVMPMNTEECSSIGTRSVDKEPKNYNTNRTEISTKRNARREQSLLSSTLLPERSSNSTAQDVPQSVSIQVSPSTAQPKAVVVSRRVSADVAKDLLESGRNNRKTTSTRTFDLLDDGWITKWRETLSTESLERERKIVKEKLRLEAIRREKDNYEKISEEVKARMRGNVGISVIEDKVDSFKELTPEMNCMIDKALCRGAANEQLVETSLGHIIRGDVATLGQQNWLNDEIVNYYFHMIADRSKKAGPKVIDFKTKTFSYYDSLKGENGKCLQDLRDYLCAESLDKKKTKLDLTGWKSDSPRDIPEQLNGCDCGVFICKYAEYISRREKFDFTQNLGGWRLMLTQSGRIYIFAQVGVVDIYLVDHKNKKPWSQLGPLMNTSGTTCRIFVGE